VHHGFHGTADHAIQQSIASCSRLEKKLYAPKNFRPRFEVGRDAKKSGRGRSNLRVAHGPVITT